MPIHFDLKCLSLHKKPTLYSIYFVCFYIILTSPAFISVSSQQASKYSPLNRKPGLETLFTSNINAWCWLGLADRKTALLG